MHAIAKTSYFAFIPLFLISTYIIWVAASDRSGNLFKSRSATPATEPQASVDRYSIPAASETGDCQIKAWVRAPDLVPSQVIHGEVRVRVMEECIGKVAKYELGLRFRERSAFKFPYVKICLSVGLN